MSAVNEDDDSEVVGKVVKISILQELQRFRKLPATEAKASINSNDDRAAGHHDGQLKGSVSNRISTSVKGSVEKGQRENRVEDDVDEVDNSFMDADEAQVASSGKAELKEYPETETLNVVNNESSETEPELPMNPQDICTNSRENVIRPINRDVVHQICSGQVIVTLSTAVKELVENSVDAGATKIDIRLVESGSKLIEVADDASGIEEINFEGLAMKHHTSKISEFEDLGNLSTFGFRGEALSSLCALANLTVITRHKDSDKKSGYKIEYDYKGHITSKTRCARDFGTTVVLKDLFHTLPVRHKEFNKNLKKEFHRMVNVLYGYCLVVEGVRITCTNQVGSGAPQKVLAVSSNNSMKERIVTLFGSKQMASLIQITQCDEVSGDILADFGLNEKSFEKKYEIEGYISKPNHGRSSNDRQFYFVNSRPCDPAKISRVINEVYHSFSRQQNPFVCLHIKTNRENVDVNVTPDKRTVYVQNEKILLALIKASLIPILTAAASSYNPINSLSQTQLTLSFTGTPPEPQPEAANTSLCLSSSFEINSDASQQQNDSDSLGFDEQYSTSTSRIPRSVIAKTNSFIQRISKGATSYSTSSYSSGGPSHTSPFSSTFKRVREDETTQTHAESNKQPKLSGYLQRFKVKEKKDVGEKEQRQLDSDELEDQEESNVDDFTQDHEIDPDLEIINDDSDNPEVLYDDEIDGDNTEFLLHRQSVSVSINWRDAAFKDAAIILNQKKAYSSDVSYARKFRAKISPEDNSVAEDELRKQLTKDMFQKMDIVGQFNLGFVIVKNGPDLFIVDQHASDEKFNYEDQEKTTVLNGQFLISPLDLDIPAVSENIIMDNVEVFQKNGFDFVISPDEEPRKRVKMSKIPFSKNIEFGKSDVEELIFMLEDASSGKCFYRPSKVREMFASRACRKSVMIGTALSQKEMRVIVDHMGEMDQPWNCPHGRPTIRHLINLNLLPDLDLTKFNH